MRIFISSTYKDLISYRSAVAKALEKLGLKVERMETFGARPQDATQVCLTEIEASDLFLGIYAHRYGYVPLNSAISITEAEFDYAFKNRRPTFCFFVDEGYTWPKEFVEDEPGRSLLAQFKARVEGLVVREFFTTPDNLASGVTSSIGRYLLADPRRHDAPNAAKVARLTLTDIATSAFVDVMRLTCIAGNISAKAVSESSYSRLVDTAEQSISDFRTQVTRLAADADSDTLRLCGHVERGLAWAIVRLRREPKLDRSWREFVGILRDLAEWVNALAESVSRDYYAGRREEVTSIIQATIQQVSTGPLADSPGEFIRHRDSAQQAVLDQMQETGQFVIATIRDDIEKRAAVAYFTIYLVLLGKAMEE